jgi:integrase
LNGSPKQKKNVMDALRNFFRWLLAREEIKRIPPWPEMDQVIEHERWTLTYDEQQEVLGKIPEAHRDIIEFLMETGLRPAEACALMKIDIKVSERKALIRHNYSEAELRERTKQKKEYWIVFSDRAWELIVKNIGNPTPFVFWNAPYERSYRYKVLNKAWTKTGCPVGLYEATRHSLATQLMEAGEPLKRVQGIMRHADSRTTLRYEHAGDENTRKALNRRGAKVIELKKDVGDT